MAPSIESSRGNSTSNLEILVGTYEEFVLGYKLTENSEGVSDFFYGNLVQNCSDLLFVTGTNIGAQFHKS